MKFGFTVSGFRLPTHGSRATDEDELAGGERPCRRCGDPGAYRERVTPNPPVDLTAAGGADHDATVAAGPVGRNAQAKTDATMRAEILSYSRSRGVFAGISLEGGTLREDDSANKDLYGKAMANRTILTGGVPPPASAASFLTAIKTF